jgi:hypothetical protein
VYTLNNVFDYGYLRKKIKEVLSTCLSVSVRINSITRFYERNMIMKKLSGVSRIAGLCLFLLLASSSLVFGAHGNDNGQGGNNEHRGTGHLPAAPEPVSYLLILAGGATLVGLRRWRNKKNSNKHAE